MTQITTTTGPYATAFANQRKIDRTSNGVLWNVLPSDGDSNFRTFYSTDNGATWTAGGTFQNGSTASGGTYTKNISFFIDLDDYAHVVFKDNSNGSVYYRRGTPNAGRTSYTWSAATIIWAGATIDYPDVVAFRSPHNAGGWHVCFVGGYLSGSANYAGYARIDIAANGTLGTIQRDNLNVLLSQDGALGGSYANNTPTFPSIDFNHNGDGKTVGGGTPHIYVAWNSGASGAGKGIRFRKATYAAGAWTWAAEREIDSTHYVEDTSRSIRCSFDGTRVIIDGHVYTGSQFDIVLYDRDVADTTTTSRILSANITSTGVLWQSSSYNSQGDVYLISWRSGNMISYRKWTRATNTLGSWVDVAAVTRNGICVSAKRGNSSKRIEFAYIDGASTPYSVNFNNIILNDPPVVTISPAAGTRVDPRVNNTYSWTYSDPDGDPQTSFSASVHEASVTPTTWSGGSTAQTGTINTFTAPVTGVYTIEAIGAAGGQSSDSNAGGKGARVVGDFSLTAGEVLNVIAGKPGQKPTETSRGGGGGGASWVYKTGAAQPMLAAGGGGGGGNYAYDATVQDASITTSGKAGTVGTFGAGGTGGNGGGAGNYAGGGAGWLTNGTNGYSPVTGGATPANGAAGGAPYSTANAWGGFGGGGGAYAGAGGGAGYSGGGAGGWSSSGLGGGGGSYNAGTNQIMQAGIGTDQGSVTISMNGAVVYSTSGTTENSIAVPANSMSDEKTYYLTLTVNNAYHQVVEDHAITSNSWIEEAPVTTASQSATLPINHGDKVDVQVATSDAMGFGPYSSTVSFINNTAPSATINSPAVATETSADVKWTYADADGDPQTRYQIRIRKKI